ncbi:MAG: RagB/SusD family nutrient uptake outer membrane protein [Chitinophagaceae bacterium]|nr:RagB/SusD family nutrient uptake outer membrane protein [Chitinophagaceae bacterium]
MLLRAQFFLYALLILALSIICTSCTKYLDKKPLKSQVLPERLEDLQAILDLNARMNEQGLDVTELASDNIYISDADVASVPEIDRLNYLWDKEAMDLSSWSRPYQGVYFSNFVLEALVDIARTSANAEQYDHVKAAALFYRAFAFFELAQVYCSPYAPATLGSPGIVLRNTAAIQANSVRSTVEQTYTQITTDLATAAMMLPAQVAFSTRPCAAAAHGLLARVYLSMRDYPSAYAQADTCLQMQHALIDYNNLLPVSAPAIPAFNAETIFYNHSLVRMQGLFPPYAKIDSLLYQSYDDNDLRKELFFAGNDDGSYAFKGSYASNYWDPTVFDGIATDEMFLIRAECSARTGNTVEALQDLNSLLVNRYRHGTYVPHSASDASEALTNILRERRKELIYRGQRWTDIRRLNAEGAGIVPTRKVNGKEYTLPSEDPRWIMLIPEEIISATGMAQNPR